MRYQNRFMGHLDPGDPRTLISGAGGCRWPTIPPWRIQLSSENATGEWAFLKTRPIILQQDPLVSLHNYVLWTALEQPREVYYVRLEKIYTKAMHPRIQYFITIMLNAWDNERVWVKLGTPRCNQNLLWGKRFRTSQMGTTGSKFQQFQVEYDQLRYPGWRVP